MPMRALAVVLLKVWGVLWIVGGCAALLQQAAFFAMPGDASMQRMVWVGGLLGVVTSFAGGAVLLFGAEWIADRIGLREGGADAAAPRYTLPELQSIVFGALAVYFAVSALRNIGALAYAILQQPLPNASGPFGPRLLDRQPELAGAVTQLVAAVVLLFTRSRLASLWARVRPMPEGSEPDQAA
jgi:hypothetical protein